MSEAAATQRKSYDFAQDPISVNLHRPNSSKENKETHCIRKPTQEQWFLWGYEIYEQRRNLSQQELEEENKLVDRDGPIEWAFEKQYDEYEASRRIYLRNAVDVTAYKLDENEKLQPYKTHELTPDVIDKVIGKDVAVSGLYSCYCELAERSPADSNDEIRVSQTIGRAEDAPIVVHVLRKPTEDETRQFQTEITRTYLVADKPDTVRVSLNLPVVNQIYDSLILRIENANLGNQTFSEESKQDFLDAINPVFKLKVLEEVFEQNVWHFQYD
jgi:hypothetical protein